jgi:Chlorite dismutase
MDSGLALRAPRNDGESLNRPPFRASILPMFTVFRGGQSGAWRVTRFAPVKGAALARTPALSSVYSASIALPILPSITSWRLAGVASHVRYVERAEKEQLAAVQAGLGRPEATCAALIPIKKSAAWWEMTQEERREIFEDKSHHIAGSLKYLPAIARQLYHCRDLGEPFDFLTWFEYEPAHADAFEELVAMLRATEEWRYVEREVDIRVERERLDAG